MEVKKISTEKTAEKHTRINERIRSKEVRLIDVDGTQLGIVSIEKALEAARQSDLDLVEISPNADPPVCRVMDFGKHLFQIKKKKTDARKKQHKVQLKELKYRPGIEESDYHVKLKKLLSFIEEGDKVKVTIRYRGREMSHHEFGAELLNRIESDVATVAIVEQKPKFEGRQVVMVLSPKKK